jgi:tRNA A37 methylthiotransferase MiaB
VSGAVIKRRARELRALADRKAVAFRQSQIGEHLRVLTLRNEDGAAAATTPTLSSNYLKVHVRGIWPANRWLHVRVSNAEENGLVADVFETEELYDSKMTCASA